MLGEREQFRWIALSCLQDKKYTIEIFQDKKRSNKNANLYEHKIMDIDNKNIIEMFMASGGGFVIVIREKK